MNVVFSFSKRKTHNHSTILSLLCFIVVGIRKMVVMIINILQQLVNQHEELVLFVGKMKRENEEKFYTLVEIAKETLSKEEIKASQGCLMDSNVVLVK